MTRRIVILIVALLMSLIVFPVSAQATQIHRGSCFTNVFGQKVCVDLGYNRIRGGVHVNAVRVSGGTQGCRYLNDNNVMSPQTIVFSIMSRGQVRHRVHRFRSVHCGDWRYFNVTAHNRVGVHVSVMGQAHYSFAPDPWVHLMGRVR